MDTTMTNNARAMIERYAPSAFTAHPWECMSGRYSFVPTFRVVEGLEKNGFTPVRAYQSSSRIDGKADYVRHEIRFRRRDQTLCLNEVFPEIVLVNSHDGSSAYLVQGGLYRLVCSNGMVCSVGRLGMYRTRHSGDIQGEVIDAAYRIVEDFPQIINMVDRWMQTPMPTNRQIEFARHAMALRWGVENEQPRVEDMLAVRRQGDVTQKDTLWGTYQRIQESLVRGGTPYYYQRAGNRHPIVKHTRPIKSIPAGMRINQGLWALACSMGEIIEPVPTIKERTNESRS